MINPGDLVMFAPRTRPARRSRPLYFTDDGEAYPVDKSVVMMFVEKTPLTIRGETDNNFCTVLHEGRLFHAWFNDLQEVT